MAAFENPSRARSTINPAEIRKRSKPPSNSSNPFSNRLVSATRGSTRSPQSLFLEEREDLLRLLYFQLRPSTIFPRTRIDDEKEKSSPSFARIDHAWRRGGGFSTICKRSACDRAATESHLWTPGLSMVVR